MKLSLIPWRKNHTIPVTHDATLAPPVSEFRGEMDRLFDRYFARPWSGLAQWADDAGWSPGEFMPSIDVAEKDTEIAVRAEVPGMEAENIDISVSGNTLTIRGEKKESSEEKRDDYYHSERRFGSFTRSIELPPTADAEAIEAELVNGVLNVSVKKLASAPATKRIEVKPTVGPLASV